jgi:hypothetical protein
MKWLMQNLLAEAKESASHQEKGSGTESVQFANEVVGKRQGNKIVVSLSYCHVAT